MKKTKLIASLVFCIFMLASWMYGKNQERIIVQTPFKPVKKVYPDYPEILKKKGVAARFLISISIDRKGNVTRANIWNSLYPELEENIKEAFLQWKFEPFIHKKKPMRIFGFIMLIFYPGKSSPTAIKSKSRMIPVDEELAISPDEELQMVLDKCAEYCLKLSESALYYVCHEKIREKLNKIEGPEQEIGIILPHKIFRDTKALTRYGAYYNFLKLGDAEKHIYVYDYQLIRKEGHIKEKRILMEKDKKNVNLKAVSPGTKPSYSLKPILVPVQLLSIEQRSKYSFRLADEEKISGKLAYVIEAYLRPDQTGNIKRGRIWVDKSDFRIVKVEVETDFVAGYEQILAECHNYYLKPHFKSTHYYDINKNDLLFPSRSEIHVEYSGLLKTKRALKSELKVTYENYKFFTVETDHDIIKKKIEALLSNRCRPVLKNSIRFSPYIFRHF